ncbi:MAG TPA: NAD(P)/FAD-dependent oxidoreductase [Stackebrandtia sp.]|jgi:2-polyprenyl-6-methoxyphenol hydroxylase-like FAD-dependent oxidoreductase|uniref:FAD-dependent oxidoreductase n=1 Tax=Stackebrandtia sp. TaxID=2023065 RepID=UPI002D397E16|nr:NAD(P)/FAD-dependent oxidoreductase [Stackebrandtia sp.]HZE38811.1 NAD(P)/FAD-dependent oxidoreductase [Stackebrandtia sp.]
MNSPRIAIVGAGIGGLACARVLDLKGLRATVFEREDSADSRSQGGSLDMHSDTGQAALRAAGLLERFHELARPEGQEGRTLDRAATVLRHHVPGPDERDTPEIDRGQLRGLMLETLPPGMVQWGRGVDGVTAVDGGARIAFADGTTADFDLVIGADGAWSRVRPAVSEATPIHTGVNFVEFSFDDADRAHPDLARMVGGGTMTALAPNRCMAIQRNSNGHLRVYAAFWDAPDWHAAAGIDMGDARAVRSHLLTVFEGWDDRLLDFVRRTESGFINRPLFALPAPHDWSHVPGVTLLGDAAHLMPPLGVGANLAMLDGTDLAASIAAASTVDEGVRVYEDLMLPRAGRAAKLVGDGLRVMLGPEAPESALRFYDQMSAED